MSDPAMSNESISVGNAFDAMRAFLESYWIRGGKQSDDIAILLGALNRDEPAHMPLDEALWNDWIEAIKTSKT